MRARAFCYARALHRGGWSLLPFGMGSVEVVENVSQVSDFPPIVLALGDGNVVLDKAADGLHAPGLAQ